MLDFLRADCCGFVLRLMGRGKETDFITIGETGNGWNCQWLTECPHPFGSLCLAPLFVTP